MHTSKYLWYPGVSRRENVYVMFQTELMIEQEGTTTVNLFGSSVYRAYIDGTEFVQGPARFEAGHPEYDECQLDLRQGKHVLSVVVHYYGVSTRMLAPETPAFLQCEILGASGSIPLQWKCKELEAFAHSQRRLNVQLGWMEQCDMRLLPDLALLHMGADWVEPEEVAVQLGAYCPKSIADCYTLPREGKLLAEGAYTNRFGYENDDLPIRFMMRDLAPGLPPEGVWLRFDLGLIGLYSLKITLDVPSGTIVEAGYSESLTDRRVCPIITLSASNSCNMDRWITDAGKQVLQTFSQRGFRFLELHISDPDIILDQIRVEGMQRTYFDKPRGAFHCSDPLLNDIWLMGLHTLQACSEDALTDTPTRERGQWLGDAVAVGMETLSVSFGDLSLIRRGLLQASHCRSPEGMVSGLYPGQNGYLSSYALLWVSGCMRYYWKTGDRALLSECYDTAEKTIALFSKKMSLRGITEFEWWDFIDWGHSIEAGEINVSLNLMMLGALRDLALWEKEIGEWAASERRIKQAESLEAVIRQTFLNSAGIMAHSVASNGELKASSFTPGYHSTVLALWLNLLDGEQKKNAVHFVKQHMLHCFPNDISAPRLSHPAANHNRLITPYFSHFALHALWEAGEADFVLEQYRVCWGWMIESGATTLLEVFDPRWSHCHAWSACPTWQLSRHLLGLLPDESGDASSFYWNPKPGSLEFAEGKLPLDHVKGQISIKWHREEQEKSWIYELQSDQPIKLQFSSKWRLVAIEADGLPKDSSIDVLHVNKSLRIIFEGKY